EHLYPLANLDLHVGDGLPRFVAEYRLLKADPASFIRAHVADHEADLAHEGPLGKSDPGLVGTALEDLEPGPDQRDRAGGPGDDLISKGKRGENHRSDSHGNGSRTEPEQEERGHGQLEEHQDYAQHDPVPPQDFHAPPGTAMLNS